MPTEVTTAWRRRMHESNVVKDQSPSTARAKAGFIGDLQYRYALRSGGRERASDSRRVQSYIPAGPEGQTGRKSGTAFTRAGTKPRWVKCRSCRMIRRRADGVDEMFAQGDQNGGGGVVQQPCMTARLCSHVQAECVGRLPRERS